MKKFLSLVVALALVACSRGTENYTPQPFHFSGAPIRLNVAEIRVIPTYQSPLRSPNTEHLFPTPPMKAVHQWVGERMVASGGAGVLEVAIEDASVREVKLPKKTGLEGFFTDEQDMRYDASLKVSMRLYSGTSGLSVANADVIVTRSQTINEKASVAERERLFDTITREMMAQFDAETQAQLGRYFSAYLIR